MTIIAVLQVPVTGESEVSVCKKCRWSKRLQNKMVSNRWNILWYVLTPLIGGAIVGGLIFKLGFMIHNPKTELQLLSKYDAQYNYWKIISLI